MARRIQLTRKTNWKEASHCRKKLKKFPFRSLAWARISHALVSRNYLHARAPVQYFFTFFVKKYFLSFV